MSYSPVLGRFIQRDPIGYVDGGSLYGCEESDPTEYDDPMGLQRKTIRIFVDRTGLPRTFNADHVAAALNRLLKACACKNSGDSFEVKVSLVDRQPTRLGWQGYSSDDEYYGYVFSNPSFPSFARTSNSRTEMNWQRFEDSIRNDAGNGRIDWDLAWANFLAHEQIHLGLIGSHDYGDVGEITSGAAVYDSAATLPKGWCETFLASLGLG